ncbi:dynein regulatory complex subunit 2-like [Aulostomus maculatus]
MAKLSSLLNTDSHPMHNTLTALESSFSDTFLHPKCVKERFRRSFLPAAKMQTNPNNTQFSARNEKQRPWKGKEQFKKEKKNAVVNHTKLAEKWHVTLEQPKSAELQEDIVMHRQEFEKKLEGLEEVIKTLASNLEQVDGQLAQVWRVHLEHLESLRALQEKKCGFLQQQWEGFLQQISSRIDQERVNMVTQCQEQQASLEDIVSTQEERHQAWMDEIHKLHNDTVNGHQSAAQDRLAGLVRVSVEELTLKACERRRALLNYKPRAEEVEHLKSRNQHMTETMNADMKKVQQLQKTVADLQGKLNAEKQDIALETRKLVAEKAAVDQATLRLQHQMSRAHDTMRKQLADLSVHSDAAAKKLCAVMDKGKRVLTFAELCNKLERKQKNDLPLPADAQRQETDEQVKTSKFSELRQLMQRYTNTLHLRQALMKKRQGQRQENEQRRFLLRQYLDAMAVRSSDRDECNAVLSV